MTDERRLALFVDLSQVAVEGELPTFTNVQKTATIEEVIGKIGAMKR